MDFNQRGYSGEVDQDRMIALTRQYMGGYLHVIDLAYRLSSWGLDEPQNTSLWFDSFDFEVVRDVLVYRKVYQGE